VSFGKKSLTSILLKSGNMKKFLLNLLGSIFFLTGTAQLVVTDSIDSAILTQWLEGANISIINANIECAGSSIGTFTYSGLDLGIGQGVLLSSGAIQEAVGPNDASSASTITNNAYTDEDLQEIVDVSINDVCIISFDCVPDFQYLMFDYVFGSEEYPEYVNSFNDGFAFFVSGPGINGPYSYSGDNFCTIPNTSLPVTINNVNNGNGDCFLGGPAGPCMNCEFYIDNCGGEDLQYDGLTIVLPGLVEVQAGETYHVKIGICDALDSVFDSGVFIQKQSFRSENLLSLDDLKNSERISLNPNPAFDEFTLHGLPLDTYQFKIIDIQGKLISTQRKQVNGDMIIDIISLAQGRYLLLMNAQSGESFMTEFQKN
jgi:hypothetical protein